MSVQLIILALVIHLTSAAELKILTKEQWKGRRANGTIDSLQLPVSKVIIANTGSKSCFSEEDCSLIARSLQSYHMDYYNFSDIAYNFLVGGDGIIYAGRNWYKEGAVISRYNKDSIYIAFIGIFVNEVPTKQQIRAAQLLLEKGILEKNLTPGYKLFGHCQLSPTLSPGGKLYEIIKTWPHWSEI